MPVLQGEGEDARFVVPGIAESEPVRELRERLS
jgi:hypothetical protein